MSYVLVLEHKVRDYVQWKSHFTSNAGKRKAAGEKAYQIFHSADDHCDLVILFEWDAVENFMRYIEAAEFKSAQQESGVLGKPDIRFLEEVGKGML